MAQVPDVGMLTVAMRQELSQRAPGRPADAIGLGLRQRPGDVWSVVLRPRLAAPRDRGRFYPVCLNLRFSHTGHGS
jgi:hypothetical protein